MSYLTEVLADHPTHYWRIADPTALFAHDIGSAPVHLGGNVNNPSYSFSGISTDGGSLFTAGGAGIITRDIVSQAVPLSVEGWFWPLFASVPALGFIVSWDGAADNQVIIDSDGSHLAASATGSGGPITSGVLAIQQWHHFVAVFDVASFKFYVDSLLIGTNVAATASPIARPLGIGQQPISGANATFGFISEVAIYGSALSAARVTAHFLAAGPLSTPTAQIGGPAGGGGGLPVPNDNSTAILNAVRHTFPTT